MEQVDILVAGGGIAGLSAAARFAADGRTVALAEPGPEQPAGHGDLRTTAFLQPAIAALTRAGAWAGIEGHAAELRIMRLVDSGGVERQPRETADFEGTEAGQDRFGWNVSNALARAALLDCLRTRGNAGLRFGTSVVGLTQRLDRAIVRLRDGTQIGAKLVVAADGRDSGVRALAGIAHRRWDYGQKALVFCVTHRRPHDGISTEIHRTGGPLTLVPMPQIEGRHASSVVWMMPGRQAEDTSALDDAALARALTEATMGLFGDLTVASPRAAWPIVSQIALGLTAPRVALVAEAAHVMPPIGAQGLNTSLDDIEVLATLTEAAPDPGAPGLLARYQARQYPKILTKVAGIDLLNRAARTEIQALRDLRHAGLSAISRIAPLRKLAIRAGLGS